MWSRRNYILTFTVFVQAVGLLNVKVSNSTIRRLNSLEAFGVNTELEFGRAAVTEEIKSDL